jgi:hypothetical protein
MDVVLVTGERVTVSATNQYSDLFRALKGGANRFGIVTRYELYAAHTGTKDDKEWYGGVITVRVLSFLDSLESDLGTVPWIRGRGTEQCFREVHSRNNRSESRCVGVNFI